MQVRIESIVRPCRQSLLRRFKSCFTAGGTKTGSFMPRLTRRVGIVSATI